MVEAMRIRGLLIIAMFAWVGPVAAHGPSSAHKGDCPAARAKAEATAARQGAATPAHKSGAWMAPRAVAPPADVPGEGSIFGMGRSSVLMP
jgi:hypothetical protein